jgi:hypothetical protein
MSDTPPAYPPPPPSGMTPPSQPPPPPGQPVFQAPAAPDYVQPYLQQQPYGPQPMAVGGVMAGGLMYQLGGPAAWSIGFGLVSIVVPFAFNYYFPLLPIAGAISAIRAIQRGRVVGGIIGIAVNVVGGLVALLASGVIGG